ncbi:sugar transferase [Nesterenkonia sp. HG001]|uniref:sugar transferase n=1 Tax=Nesterenkonia sp. HG001 TaxID=2983207 RepID=UPI002AC5EBDB|nr:sugar transferase [Nesterenkonia sp. HG001]MDZ5077455.1 sugar transferase [Nesterenkonia sp. HG001]
MSLEMLPTSEHRSLSHPGVDLRPPSAWRVVPPLQVQGLPAGLGTTPGGTSELRRWRRGLARRIAVSDGLIILLVLGGLHLAGALTSTAQGLLASGGVLALWMLLLALCRTRNARILGSGAQEFLGLAAVSATVMWMTAVGSLILDEDSLRAGALLAVPAGALLLLVGRLIWRHRLRRHWDTGVGLHRALVIGEDGKARHIADHLRRLGPVSGYQVVELLVREAGQPLSSLAPSTLAGLTETEAADPEQIIRHARDAITRDAVDTVILTSADQLTPRALRELGWALAALDVDLVVAPSLSEISQGRLHTRSVDGMPLMHVDYPRLSGGAAALKRAFDIVFALTALLAIAPVLVAAAVAVRLDSPGPVFFSQTRVGLRHSSFQMLKFRSMVVDAEARREELLSVSEGNAVMFKMRRDPRVTRVGTVIRRYSIDELPQFLNVLRGEMSVVGPRPPLVSEVEAYDENSQRRLLVKPGITGLWQVGGRSDLSWEDSVRLDLYYVENWSLAGDVGIVLRTLRAVLRGAGAY